MMISLCADILIRGENVVSVVLGQYKNNEMFNRGHVTLGVSREAFGVIAHIPKIDKPAFAVSKGDENANWIKPVLVCVVSYMKREGSEMPQQSVFKGLRPDKSPEECILREK